MARRSESIIEYFGMGIYAAYIPIRDELSPLLLVSALSELGCKTAMPRTPPPGECLTFWSWKVGDELSEGLYGTKEPQNSGPVVYPNVILAPLLAFDKSGTRLGYGGGYYDRTVASLRENGRKVTFVGIAYEGQRFTEIPAGPYDVKLDAVVCPSGIKFGVGRE